MIADQYSVNIYFVVVFDINLDVTSHVVCWRRGFPLSQRSFLYYMELVLNVIKNGHFRLDRAVKRSIGEQNRMPNRMWN